LASDYYVSEISIVDKELPKEVKEGLQAANDYPRVDATINVLFIKGDRTEVHTLLDEHGYFSQIDFPGKYLWSGDEESTDERTFILYEISTRDTNGDSRINDQDSSSYYISGLDGRDLKKITPDSLQLDSYWYTDDFKTIYFERILKGEKVRAGGLQYELKDRRIYYYDLETEEFGPFEELERTFDRIQSNFKSNL
jgi:hypothetical protein